MARKPYVQIDDDMPGNPKIQRVSIAARWTYTASICYAGHYLTDGEIPKTALGKLDGNAKIANELVAVGLWEKSSDGWWVHDYLEHNRSKAQVEAIREKNRSAGARGLEARWRSASEVPSEMHGETMAKPVAKSLQARVDSDSSSEGSSSSKQELDTSEELTDGADGEVLAKRHRRGAIGPEDILRWEAANPELDIGAFVDDYLNWTGSTGHKDKVKGFENQLRIQWKRKQFTRKGASNGTSEVAAKFAAYG